jgi:hypothetical protein
MKKYFLLSRLSFHLVLANDKEREESILCVPNANNKTSSNFFSNIMIKSSMNVFAIYVSKIRKYVLIVVRTDQENTVPFFFERITEGTPIY